MGDQEKTRQYILLGPGVSSRTPLSDATVDELRATTPGPPPEAAVYSAKPFTPGPSTLVHAAPTTALTACPQDSFINRVPWWAAFIVSFLTCIALIFAIDRWRVAPKRSEPAVLPQPVEALKPPPKVTLHEEGGAAPEFISPPVREQPPGWSFKKKKKHRRHRRN